MRIPLLLALACMITACSQTPREPARIPSLTKRAWGQVGGQPVDLFTLTNASGVEVSITNYGGIVVSFKAPDSGGRMDDIVLGFDSLDGYLKEHPYFGAIIGRYGNRIGKARFTLNRTEYRLAANNGANHLHGGIKGFDKVVWTAREVSQAPPTLALSYASSDGEEGYPGTLNVTVTYALAPDNALRIEYFATTDKDTVVNLTNHSYFNLAGPASASVLAHSIQIQAERFTPVDSGLIPTGELRPVEGTPFDFTSAHAIGERIDADDEQMRLGKGYDHNFVLTSGGGALSRAARVTEPTSGRILEVHTTEPGVQFYTGNFLDGSVHGKGGRAYGRRSGYCLETQHFPDSPNRPGFPSTLLRPGEQYRSTTIYKVSAQGPAR